MPLVSPHIAALQLYEPGLGVDEVRRRYGVADVRKLASNENPLGASPLAIAAIHAEAAGLNRYPDGGLALRRKLAERFSMKVENVIVGNGSEGIMSNIMRTFLCDEDEILTTEAAFIGFQILGKSRGVRYRTVPYDNWRYDLPALAQQINERTKIIYLANPNNPTGTIFTRGEFEAFYRHVPERVLIILDEAYFEYAHLDPEYPDSLAYRYDNVITLRTFSKSYGLAGVRLGYGFAHEELIRNLLKVKLPFEPSALAEAAGIAALGDEAFLAQSLELNAEGVRFLSQGLTALGLRVIPTRANFVMVELADAASASRLFEDLLSQGIIVRPLRAWGLPHCLRISTGSREDNQRCVKAVETVHSLALPA